MNKIEVKKTRRVRAKFRVRKNIFGTALKPRISVFKSNKYFYAQAIDDENGVTLASATSLSYADKDLAKRTGSLKNLEVCKKVGVELAKALKEKNVEIAVLDRNGFLYTGKIASFTDALRENGIKI